MTRIQADNYGTEPIDMLGNKLKVGDSVARPYRSGNSAYMEICEVTRIENGNVYLSGSKVPLNYPGRCLIINEIMEKHIG